jgi:hypothetical protein
MIELIRSAQRITLPSGNEILVLAKHLVDDEWICEFTVYAKARGEVIFSGTFLRRFGRLV